MDKINNKIKKLANSVYCRFVLLFGILYLLILFPILNYSLNKYTIIFSIINIIICLILIGCIIVIILEFVKYGKPVKIFDEIRKSMDIITKKTNNLIKFIPKKSSTNNYVKFKYNKHLKACGSAKLGMFDNNDNNHINLRCIDYDTIIHEILHKLGFKHEFNRYDRDMLEIPINNNIIESNYIKRDYVLKYEEDLPYDIYSVMNYDYEGNELKNKYDDSFFRILNTIKLYKCLFKPINTVNVLTDIDIKKIKKLYNKK